MAAMPLLSALILLASSAAVSATWCVCNGNQPATSLQKALDYACGAGADCSQILQNGACYNPNTVLAHCSYAVNSYFQRKGQAAGSCDFAGTAVVTGNDPSSGSCSFPSTSSAAGTPGSTSPGTTTPGTAAPGTTPGSTSPGTTTPGTATPGTTPGTFPGGTTNPGTTMAPPATTTSTMGPPPLSTFSPGAGGGMIGSNTGPPGVGTGTDSSDNGMVEILPRFHLATLAALLAIIIQ